MSIHSLQLLLTVIIVGSRVKTAGDSCNCQVARYDYRRHLFFYFYIYLSIYLSLAKYDIQYKYSVKDSFPYNSKMLIKANGAIKSIMNKSVKTNKLHFRTKIFSAARKYY